ncbi:hypothetical protein ACEN2I_17995 [Flavobacterium sp. W22_SRS_FK3]|uniref:hypothetical protein n=1 Tax=Flavobacterium sp. W22_SRS_FK3 TaxID=3240275 RepID=UPI003F918377
MSAKEVPNWKCAAVILIAASIRWLQTDPNLKSDFKADSEFELVLHFAFSFARWKQIRSGLKGGKTAFLLLKL